jgi:YD repeat-containing protein
LIPIKAGNLRKTQPLTSTQDQGVDQGASLVYDSLRADPAPIVQIAFNFDPFSFPNDPGARLVATLKVARGGFSQVVGSKSTGPGATMAGQNFWSLPVSASDVQDLKTGVVADLSSFPTGSYNFTLTIGVERLVGSGSGSALQLDGTTSDLTGQVTIVNGRNSPFGSGWQLDGYASLSTNADGSIVMADGDGGQFVFEPPAGAGQPYVSPPGEYLTLVRMADGSYRMTDSDHNISAFDATGKLLSVTDRSGNATTYVYDSSGQLAKIVDPAGQATTFTSAGGHIMAVTDPAGRTTQLAYDASGNLTGITQPDGSTVAWTYDATHHLTTETDPRGLMKIYTYDAYGRIKQVTLADGSINKFAPEEVQGLFPADQTENPASAPQVPAAPAQSVGTVTYASGRVVSVVVDDDGDPLARSDSMGTLSTLMRDTNDLVTFRTDGLGNPTTLTYDGNGNLVAQRDALSSPAVVHGTLASSGQVDHYSFTAAAGERIFYNALGTQPQGLMATLFQPDGTQAPDFFGGAFNSGPIALKQAGTYELRLSGATGSYAFQVIDATQAEPLPIGQERTGSLVPSLGVELYRYDATAGTRFRIDDLATASGGSAQVDWAVYGPNNQPITNERTRGFEATLPTAGTYVVVATIARLSSSTTTGTGAAAYDVRFSNPPTTTQTLALDTDTTASFSTPGARVAFTFSGTAGQEIALVPESPTSQVSAQLVAPDGTTSTLDFGTPLFLTQTGGHTLVVEGQTPGTFQFRLATAAALPVLTIGTPLDDTADAATPVKLYQIHGTAGQRLSFDLQSLGQAAPFLTIFGPAAQRFDNLTTLTLPADGTVIVMVQSVTFVDGQTGETFLQGGPYQLTVTDISGTPVAVSGLGTTSSGSLTLGQTAEATFTAPAGRLVAFDTLDTSAALAVELDDRTGAMVAFLNTSADSGPILLPRSGTYTVKVSGGPGSYSFRFVDLTGAPTLPLGTVVDQTIATSFALTAYQFTGTPGQQVYYDGLAVPGNAPLVATLCGPGDLIDESRPGHSVSPVFRQAADTDSGFLTLTEPGTYFLVFDNTNAARVYGTGPAGGGEYSFRLLDPTSAPVLADDTLVSVTLANPAQTDLYRVSGQAGDTLFATFPSSSNEFDLQGALIGPGISAGFRPTGSDLFQPLSRDGTYLIAVEGSGTLGQSPISYTLRTSLHPASTAALKLGQATTATIAQPGQRVEYTFHLDAGQRLFFDGLDPFSASAETTLFDPDGSIDRSAVIFGTYEDSTQIYVAPASGTYRLDVSAGTAGSYHFAVDDVASSPSLSFETLVAGHLASVRQTELFQFAGTAGQRLYFGHAPNPAQPFPGQWTLYGPDGTTVSNDAIEYINSSTDFLATLPAAGTYVLTLSDSSATGPLDFQFEVYTPAINTRSVNVDGTTTAGTLADPGQKDVYTFTATAGQRILLDNTADLETSARSASLTLAGPLGPITSSDVQEDTPFVAPVTGTYRVTAPGYDGATGAYAFRLIDADHAPAVVLNQSASVSLAPYQSAVFTLAGLAGQRFHFAVNSVTGDTFVTGWGLYDANFHAIAGGDLSQSFDATLPAAGTYVLLLSAYRAANSLSFTVAPIADTPVPASGFGAVHSGTVAAGQTATFTYAAPAGLPVYFDWQLDPSTSSPVSLTFTGPGGTEVFSVFDDQGPFVLPVSGTYTLTLHDYSATDAAAYAFRLLDLTTVPALTLGTMVQSTLNPSSARDFYQFTGTFGQRLFFDAVTAPPAGFSYQLLAPDGPTLSLAPPTSGGPIAPVTLTEAGRYYLTASQFLSPLSPSTAYSFSLSDLATAAPPLPLGQPVNGQLNPGTAASLSTIAGTAGEALDFHSLSVSPTGSGVATWTLFAPDGTTVGGSFSGIHDLASDFSATLPADGTYVLVIAGTSTAGAVSYSVEVSQPSSTSSSAPPIVLLTGRTGSLRYTYDPTFNQITDTIDELGRETQYTIDPSTGNTLAMALVNPSGGENAVTHYTYTAHGLLASETDPLGRETTYAYDALDRLMAVTQGAGTALAATTRTEYDAAVTSPPPSMPAATGPSPLTTF